MCYSSRYPSNHPSASLKQTRAPSTLRLTPRKPLVSTGREADETDADFSPGRAAAGVRSFHNTTIFLTEASGDRGKSVAVCVIQMAGLRSARECAGIRVGIGSWVRSGVSCPSLCIDITPCISVCT